jgi:hypothetical protein
MGNSFPQAVSFRIYKKAEDQKPLGNDETKRDFSMFMVTPDEEQKHQCYEAFYDAMSNVALQFCICPVCVQEDLIMEGEQTSLLSDPLVREILKDSHATNEGRSEIMVLNKFWRD